MWSTPTEKQLAKIPALYSTEKTALKDKKIYMHFFMGGCDWWVVEYDPEERLLFGFACLNGDEQNAEWGYVSLDELISINVRGIHVDRDRHWTVRPAKEVSEIVKMCPFMMKD